MGLLRPGQSGQGGKGDSRDTSTFVTRMSLPADSSCEGRVSLRFTQSGLLMPAAAGVMDEKGSEYILPGPHWDERVGRAPPWLVWAGVWFSSLLHYPFSKGPGQHIMQCLKNQKCENENKCSSKYPSVLGSGKMIVSLVNHK